MANQPDPEPCMLHREVQCEALTGEADGPAIEPRNQDFGMPMLLGEYSMQYSSNAAKPQNIFACYLLVFLDVKRCLVRRSYISTVIKLDMSRLLFSLSILISTTNSSTHIISAKISMVSADAPVSKRFIYIEPEEMPVRLNISDLNLTFRKPT